MTLPSTNNAISMANVNTELGLSASAVISLNDSAVRSLLEVPSGQISLSSGWGKSNIFIFSIYGGMNINLANAAYAAGWNGTSEVRAFNFGLIGSNSIYDYALTFGGFPRKVTLFNGGYIVGAGGAGGRGPPQYGVGPSSGGNGGHAIGLGFGYAPEIYIGNSGVIAGGGGGGGGGSHAEQGYGGGGGGGAGSVGGAGGSSRTYTSDDGYGNITDYGYIFHNGPGYGGDLEYGGAGGPGAYYGGYGNDRFGGPGGAGGNLGYNGSGGPAGYNHGSGASGGIAGYGIVGTRHLLNFSGNACLGSNLY